ncbi:MAG: c-type cytochrome [bacterium]|uniref:C-type cytochrome n=1 Tax=Candidatus Methylomirabilis tolerans TaxID=3123416 RepID=A0AAJ1AJH2_9BACT|nr:c-type cytochrome [Candidatus Methylomirabilis sp.]
MGQWAKGVPIIAALIVVGGFLSQSGAQEPYKLELPLGLQKEAAYIPPDNPLTAEKIELGRQLYFDGRLSADGTVSCATCHAPDKGFSDNRPTSIGIKGQVGGRNAPMVINRIFSQEQFWDGRSPSLEDQALGPVQNPIEMGNTLKKMVATLNTIQGYRKQFKQVFGTKATAAGAAKAIAAFERSLVCGNSAFDRYEDGDDAALSESEQQGLQLFREKANCLRCHTGFAFTDERYHNLGVGFDKPKSDLGRYTVTKKESDKGAFKTPTLRNIAASAPYLHDGSAKTLEDVIEFYDKGGIKNPHLSNEIKPLNLTAKEKADLVAFLKSLSCPDLQVATPTLPR